LLNILCRLVHFQTRKTRFESQKPSFSMAQTLRMFA
jgi:hypothetical protein